ncbi:MAG: hypothetical protein DMD35_16675 [Gemmatimonadetes bacterium]|nr:MAG: hypothetical protein DMD35_16675 [Gemmatimonadota bacterium]
MSKYTRRLGAPFVLLAALSFGACTVSDSKSDTSLARDTALNRDLELANRDSAVQPQLKDVPATPAAEAPAPAPTRTTTPPKPVTKPAARPTRPVTPPPPAPTTRTTASGNTETRNAPGTAASNGGGAVGTIASGSSLSLRSNARVCTNTYTVGQTFTATVANAVSGSKVTQLKRSENANDKIIMEFAVRSVSINGRSYPVTGTVADADVERVRNQPKNKDVQKVATGAAIGAIAGQILGKSTKSTIIGAAAGAAGGAATAAATANYEGCVPDGGSIAVNLSAPLQVRVTS